MLDWDDLKYFLAVARGGSTLAAARALGVNDSFNARQNILGGAKYLRELLDRFDGDMEMALKYSKLADAAEPAPTLL